MLEGLVIALTIFASHPAQNTDGRLLSVEDAVGSNMGVIHLKRHYWTADGKLTDVKPEEPEVVWPLPLSEGDGIVYDEKNILAIADESRIIAIGNEAFDMLGKAPSNISVTMAYK